MLDRLDVLIPTRNRKEELVKTINTHLSFGINTNQFYVLDDASDSYDPTELLRDFPGLNLFINKMPRGQLRSRNTLFNNSSRQYVLSLDDDSNVLKKEHLEKALETLSSSSQFGIFSFRTFEQLENPSNPADVDPGIRKIRTFIACGALIKRELIKDLGNYTREELGYYCEEYDCSIRAYKLGYLTITRDDLIVHHRVDRSHKNIPEKSNIQTGVFGRTFRSKMGFSDNLIITTIYYPWGFDLLFIVYYILRRLLLFGIKRGDWIGFSSGLLRFISKIPYSFTEADKLSYTLFLRWFRLRTQ